MLGLALLLPNAYTTDGHASQGLSVIGLDSMHTAQAAALNRTEALVQWANKCMQVPSGLDVQKDCFNLAIAGSGSRTVFAMANDDHWVRAAHEHAHTLAADLSGSNPARCFVVQLKEPAGRLESWYKDLAQRNQQTPAGGTLASVSLDEYFEKHVLGEDPGNIPERTYPVIKYFRNYSGVDGPPNRKGIRKPIGSPDYQVYDSIWYGALSFYKEHGDETQVPGIDVSHVHMNEARAAPATVDAPLIDCEEKQIIVGFTCVETLVPSFWDFVNKTKAGEAVTPPTGLQVGVNPVLNVSKYPLPTEKFMLSEKNRQIWNDAFMFDDMALYRYFCLGKEDDALRQANEDAGGHGTAHGGLDIPAE